MIEDNRFNPQIAALAMPSDKTNPFSALGDGLTKWGDKYNANQLFDLTKQKTQKELDAADMNIKTSQQAFDFNEAANPLKLEDAALGIENKKIQNRLYTTQADDAQLSLDDKIAAKNLYGIAKNLDKKSRDAFFADNQGFDYIDPVTGQTRKFTSAQIAAVGKMLDDEELGKAKVQADIYHSKATAAAALQNANTNEQLRRDQIRLREQELNAKYGGIKLNMASVQKAAQEASRTSVAVNALKGLLDNYSDSRVGWLDNGIDSAMAAMSLNTDGATKNQLLKQNITALVGAAKDLIDLKGADSKAKLALIDSMTPNMSKGEQSFKEKTAALYNFIKDGYESRLKTYDPTTTPPQQYEAWAGNLLALEALEPKIKEFVAAKGATQTQNLKPVARSVSTPTNKTGAAIMNNGNERTPLDSFWK